MSEQELKDCEQMLKGLLVPDNETRKKLKLNFNNVSHQIKTKKN